MSTSSSKGRRRGTNSRRSIAARQRDKQGAFVVSCVSAGLAISALPQPTGTPAADVLLAGGLGVLVALAGSRARRWTWIWISTIASAFAAVIPLIVFAAPALVLSLLTLRFEVRSRILGAVISGLALQALLRLPELGLTGGSAILGTAAVLPVLVSSFYRLHRPGRRWAGISLGVTATVTILAGASYGLAALEARTKANQGIDLARVGLQAVRDGDTEQARGLLEQSAEQFAKADSLLSGPRVWPAMMIPILGHQANATAVMASSGSAVTRQAAEVIVAADPSELIMRDGAVPLDEIIAIQEPAAASLDALLVAQQEIAGINHAWTVPPIREAVERLDDEIERAVPQAELVKLGAQYSPAMFGSEGERRYFVAFGQPAESRFGGGFVGTYAEILASGGQVEMVESGPITDLQGNPDQEERFISDDAYLDRYGRYHPAYNLQNITASPDLPTTASVLSELYPQINGRRLDGVIYIEPAGVAALLELTDSVAVEGLPYRLDSKNVEQFLTIDMYAEFPTTQERDPVLEAAIEAVFEALTTGELAGPEVLARVLGPAAREGHLLFATTDTGSNGFLEHAGTLGAITEVDELRDYLAVHTANAGPNKLDVYLERTIDYDVTYDPNTGLFNATATVVLTNKSPPGLPDEVQGSWGLRRGDANAPPPGTAYQYVSLYSPQVLVDLVRDGQLAPVEHQVEHLRNVYSTSVQIPPGGSSTLVFRLDGATAAGSYTLDLDQQSVLAPVSTAISVEATDRSSPQSVEGMGATVNSPGGIATNGRNQQLVIQYD